MDAFKRVFSYAFKHKKELYLSIFFVVVETTFELFIPFLMSMLIDNGVKVQNMEYIYISGGIILICAFLSLITGLLFAKFSSIAAANFGKEIRLAQFKKIESYSFSNIDSFESSSLVTRVINDSALMQNTLTLTLRPLCRAPIMLILGIVLSFAINWELAIIFICLTPILALILFGVLRFVSPLFIKLQHALDDLNLVIQESLIAIRIIKVFVRQPYMEDKFSNVNNQYTKIVDKTFRMVNIAGPLTQIVMYVGTILIMYFGGNLLIESKIQEGSLTGVFSYVMQTFNSLMMLTNVCISIARCLASCYRVNQVLIKENDIDDSNNKQLKVKDGNLEFKNVSFKYFKNAKENVLSDINFKIDKGDVLGILGATGAGKSTLVELILRLYDINEGSILIDGEDIKEYSLVNLRDSISIVLQKNFLFSGTIKENILWGNKNALEEEINKVVTLSCTDELLEKLPDGINTNLGTNGNNVSGGQKQRICIARALLKHPKILILDDATSALDNATEKRLISNLSTIKDMTIIIISQRFMTLNYANKILVLDNGKVNGFGNKNDMLENNKIFASYYSLQNKGVN